MPAYITQDRQQEISLRGLMTNNITVKKTWAPRWISVPWVFFLGLINTGAVLMEDVGCESASVRLLLLRQRLWTAALGIQQNKAHSELKQAALEKQQHSVIQPLACAPEHCVYICNLTHPLGSLRPHPHPIASTLLSLCHTRPASPMCAHRVICLCTKYSQANTRPHASRRRLPRAQRRPWRSARVCAWCSFNVWLTRHIHLISSSAK